MHRLAGGRWRIGSHGGRNGTLREPGGVGPGRLQLVASQRPTLRRTDQATGQWISPGAGRVPLGQWADEWLAAYVRRAASTQASVRSSVLLAHILPRFAVVVRPVNRLDIGAHSNLSALRAAVLRIAGGTSTSKTII